jgi:hypothetical protein
MQHLHPVFHVSLLEPAPANINPTKDIELEETEQEYKVEKIL